MSDRPLGLFDAATTAMHSHLRVISDTRPSNEYRAR